MTKTLTTRQASIIIFVTMISTKLLSMNSIFSHNMKHNAWFAVFALFLLDFLFALIFIYLTKKIDMPILEYIKQKFGYAFSFVLSLFVAIMFLFKTTQVMVDIYLFFVQLIYVDINRIVFVICFATIVFYFGSRHLQSIGRALELLVYLIIFSLVVSLTLSVKSINLENLLPFLNLNFFTTSKTIFFNNLWFGDFWLIFFFVGNIKIEKNTTKSLILAYATSCVTVLVFTIVFTSVFGLTASMHRVCVIDITQVLPRLLDHTRFNWLVDFTFPIALVMGLGVYSNCSGLCIRHCIKNDIKIKNEISGLIVTASVLAICIVFRFVFTDFYRFVTNVFAYYNVFVQYVIPVILLVLLQFQIQKNKRQVTV